MKGDTYRLVRQESGEKGAKTVFVGKITEGENRVIEGDDGKVHTGSVRVKKVRCGKRACRCCPHASYAYLRYRDGDKIKEKYLGTIR